MRKNIILWENLSCPCQGLNLDFPHCNSSTLTTRLTARWQLLSTNCGISYTRKNAQSVASCQQAWTVLCCTLWTLLSTVLFRSVRTALFRADEPTGVNNAVLTVHIKHDSNHVLCCVNSTYHAWYQYCFISCWIYNFLSFTVYVIISCIIARHKNTQYILPTIYYWRQMIIHLITNNQAVATSKKSK